jgi:hypothetical protein
MAEYKGIKGFKVQYLSADPSNPIIGQTWYNSTSKDLKYTGATAAGAWASGNNLNTARSRLAGAGNTNRSISFWWYSTNYRSNRRIRWNKLGNKSWKFKHS